MRAWVLGCLVAALAAGCKAETEGAALASCDPLASATSDVALASVVAAGEGADGTVYVIDKSDGQLRAFVSRADELYRERVSGTGESEDNTNGASVTVSLNELEPALTIQVTTDTSGATRMGVVAGPLATKTFTIGEQGEELSLLTASDAKALPIHNYPPEILVEYSAALEDGRLLVVLRPRDFQDYLEFRVFFGPLDHLDERHVSNLTRARDGGSTNIDFEIAGEAAHAVFPVEFTGDVFAPGAPSLTIGNQDVALSLTAPSASPVGAAYFCVD